MTDQPKSDLKLVKPSPAEPARSPAKQYSLTDFGNAERVAARFGHLIRYVALWKQWYIWTGTHWRKTTPHQIEWLIKQSARLMVAEAQALDDDKRGKLIKHALASENQARIRATLESLKSQPGICIEPEALDRNPNLLNLLNGTLNLVSGEFYAHRPEDYITRILGFEYDPQAQCPNFLAFVDRIFEGNLELIAFVQRVFGYCLTGDTREQVFFLCIGNGANGKTTLLVTMQNLLGPYAQQAPAELLISKSNGGIPNAVAGLVGVRMAVVSELDKDCIFAEAVVKLLTGGENTRARFLFGEYFEYRPQAKIFVVANRAPAIKGTDEGIWRRILWIPFNASIPESEQDKTLTEKLKNEKAGILNWALQGLKDWQENGLKPPEIVRRSSREYRSENNSVIAFLAARCETGPGKEVQASQLYAAYQCWCENSRRELLTQKAFGSTLTALGYESRKKSNNWWQGIALRPDENLG